MKKFKKVMAMGLATIAAVSAMSMSAMAADSSTADSCNATAEIVRATANANDSYYAYMDYDSAGESIKPLIIQARKNIVFGDYAWTVNGQVSAVNEDGSETVLPEFSDLFPGWDLSIISVENDQNTPFALSHLVEFGSNVDVPAQGTSYSEPFYSFVGNGKKVYAWADTLEFGHQINFGFKCVNTGDYVGYKPNCEVKASASITATNDYSYQVRCSSKQGNCEAYICVSETKPSYVN